METNVVAAIPASAAFPIGAPSGTILDQSDVGPFERLHIDVGVATLVGGTAPTVTFTVQRMDALGVWRDLYVFPAISAVGTLSRSLGPSLETSVMIPKFLRIRFTTTGSPTSATGTISILGDSNG